MSDERKSESSGRQKLLADLHERLESLKQTAPAPAPASAGKTAEPADPSGGQAANDTQQWRASLAVMRRADHSLLLRISRKLINHLCSLGSTEAQRLLAAAQTAADPATIFGESNVPAPKHALNTELLLSDTPFELASAFLGDEELLRLLLRWLQADRARALLKVAANPGSSLQEIGAALRRHRDIFSAGVLPQSTCKSVRVMLCQRYLTDQLDFIKAAKDVVTVDDFHALLDRIVLPPSSHGKLGGKGAGLLLASWILDSAKQDGRECGEVRLPRSWYLASDAVLDFVARNDLEEVMRQKFNDPEEIRREYPNIIQIFKHSLFSPDVVRGLAAVLEDLGDRPVIIRSSSLLEDRFGTAFSGKYKSLFLANQGTPEERLDAMLDAIAEIYASVLGPDPIAYRRDRGLLEFDEQMGILIQEVVGRRVGRWFLPAFAGVAFSRNELRWSSRIGREDGLVRLVPGLGTRAVDRVGDDYPVLLVPGQPTLRANVQPQEVVRYSPQLADVIDLETSRFVTLPIAELLASCGTDFPGFEQLFSIYRDGMLSRAGKLFVDTEKDDLVVTFDGLVNQTPFLRSMAAILRRLEDGLGHPVDIEFAHDGEHFYLLQCRPQSQADAVLPTVIPRDIPPERVVFSAHRYVSGGTVAQISHVVYVDPEAYAALPDREAMVAVGRAVGRLNQVLPRRNFILMGPGRWGSRGDITLGVSVTYADISNTAMLIEVARRKGSYLPELSFGTHFFQDLVEARIRYLPLYPDEGEGQFNEDFLKRRPSCLSDLLPELAPEGSALSACLRVIDVPATSEGRILRVLLDAERDEALAYLDDPG